MLFDFLFRSSIWVSIAMVMVSYLLDNRVHEDMNAYLAAVAGYLLSLLLSFLYTTSISNYFTLSLIPQIIFISLVVFVLSLFLIVILHDIMKVVFMFLQNQEISETHEIRMRGEMNELRED